MHNQGPCAASWQTHANHSGNHHSFNDGSRSPLMGSSWAPNFYFHFLVVLNDTGCQRLVKSTARLVHPDKNLGHDDAKKAFQKVTQAFEILSDTDTRYVYDHAILDEVLAMQAATKKRPIRVQSSGVAAAKRAATKRARTSTAASSTSPPAGVVPSGENGLDEACRDDAAAASSSSTSSTGASASVAPKSADGKSMQTLFGSIDLCKVAAINTTPNDTSCGLCFARPCFGHFVVVKFIRPGNSTRVSKNKSPQWLQTRCN